ncbi:MAG: hypothetical protein LKI39_10770 [Bacteroides sp.]|nr:hypothetical protein [Bacteroides sp.]MCI1683022.1 hypothetical protein [Bacteroides sp.]
MRRRLILYWLFCLMAVMSLNSCLKTTDLYKGDKPDDGNEETKLPDLSVPTTFDWNEVYVTIPLSGGVNVNDVQVSFPQLKYNKKFVYSYTFDDDVAQAYGKAFCTINKKWVDDNKFFHVGQTKTTGSTPTKTLGYTDGCGNERRFAFGVSIWPDNSNSSIDNFMEPTNHAVDQYYPYLVWKDVVPLVDFGCDLYLHDVDSTFFNIKEVSGILSGLKICNQKTKDMIGRKMKILARPNGNDNYVTAAREYEDVVFILDGPDPITPSLAADNINLKNKCIARRFIEPTPKYDELIPAIDVAAANSTYDWLNDFSHAPEKFQFILDLFTAINDKYGKDGTDIVWFATADEVYEYNYLKRNCVITKSVSGNTLTLKIACPSTDLSNEFIYHRDFSVLLKGVTIQSDAKLSSGKNVYGLSCAKQRDGSWLVNVDCNKSLLDRAERYTNTYEAKKTSSAKEDALYFINQLKEEYRTDAMKSIK